MSRFSEMGKEILNKMVPIAYETYDGLDPFYTKLFQVEQANNTRYSAGQDFVAQVQTTWDSSTRGMPGGARSRSILNYPWQIAVRDLSAFVDIDKKDIEDVLAGGVDEFVAEYGPKITRAMMDSIEEFHHLFFNKGAYLAGFPEMDNSVPGSISGLTPLDDPSGVLLYDGVAIFATNHPMKGVSGSTLSNYIETSPLTVANLEAATLAYNATNARDNDNRRIVRRANMLIVPSDLEITARKVLAEGYYPFEATHTRNVIADMTTWELIVDPYLSDTDGWFIGSRQMLEGFKSIYHPNYPPTGAERIPFRMDMVEVVQDDGSQYYVLKAEARLGAGVTNWRTYQAQNIATS